MTRKNVIDFPGNPHPAARRAQPASIIVLPVIRIERIDDDDGAFQRRTARRQRRIDRLQRLMGDR